MGKVTTGIMVMHGAVRNEVNFGYNINVDVYGNFYTTLPPEIVEKFLAANISLDYGKHLKRYGYFSSRSMDDLKKQIKKTCEEFLSRELVEKITVIKYAIQTQCIYALSVTGDICPNTSSEWTGVEGSNDRYAADYNTAIKWIEGTKKVSASNKSAYGLQMYAKPFIKRTYKYKSGTTKIEYDCLDCLEGGEKDENYFKNRMYLKWLDGLYCIAPVEGADVKEIIYSEDIAKFFVGLISSICQINEKIKDLLEPGMIKKLAENHTKLLG